MGLLDTDEIKIKTKLELITELHALAVKEIEELKSEKEKLQKRIDQYRHDKMIGN